MPHGVTADSGSPSLQFIARLFRSRPEPDGQAKASEAVATGVDLVGGLAQLPGAEAHGAARRPARAPLAQPGTVVLESLSQKVLHGWLQNRHQTLYPLTINLRRLDARQVDVMLQVVAVALSAAGSADLAAVERVSSWLASVGADPEQVQRFSRLVAQPPPLTQLEAVAEADLGAYAYAMSLVALDQREAVNQLFFDYLAARLAVPSNVVRSVNRRYRG